MGIREIDEDRDWENLELEVPVFLFCACGDQRGENKHELAP